MLGAGVRQQQGFHVVSRKARRRPMLLPVNARLFLVQPLAEGVRVCGGWGRDDARTGATLAVNGEERGCQCIALIQRPMAPLVHERQRGRAAERALAVRRNGADDMPAAVALVLDFEPRRAPEDELRLLLLRQGAREAGGELPCDSRLIARAGADGAFPARLGIPLAQQGAERQAGGERALGVAAANGERRSEERRLGKGCVRRCRSRGWPCLKKQKT